MNPHTPAFIRSMQNPLKFRVFLFTRLPAAFFAGVRIRDIDEKHCVVSVPYKWLSQNPFRSTYFACLSMAAEMSTGSLAMAHLYKIDPPVSMLVVNVESTYFKKAVARTFFTCEDGEMFRQVISECISSGEARVIRSRSAGVNSEGELIAEFYVTWSFKVKTRK